MDPAPPSTPPVPNLMAVSDADFRLMVDGLGDYALFLLDPDGHVRSWNSGAQRFKGYLAHEIIGRHIREFYPQELQDQKWPEHELQVAGETGRFEDEGWRVRKDGSRFWANIIITRLQDAAGRLRGFSKITRDLSERREQEEMLRNSEERFRLLVEGVHDYAIFLLDVDGNIASWNSGAQRNKGYLPSEVIGRHFSIFYPREVVESGWPAEELRIALADGRFEDQGWRVRKDGTQFWASVVITALHDHRGEHRGFAKVTRDLTDKRRIHTLEDEGRRTTSFLAMLGHELRNPLAPMSNALAIIERAAPGSAHAAAAQAVMSRQLAQMTRLVDDLLDVSRITSGKIYLDRRPVHLCKVLAEAVEASEPQARASRQQLRMGRCDDALWAHADRARMLQVVGNLLTNAIKFTPPGGEISVELRRDGDNARLAVKDSGVGIADHMLDEIFRPFVQAEQDSARSKGGLGLGLSLVQQIVALHGGTVSVFSSMSGHSPGSEFVVTLPLVDAVTVVDEATPPLPDADGRKLLIVDDNRDAADTLAVVLEAIGYRCECVYDGEAAVQAARTRPVDAVLLDLGLPGLDGLQVAQHLHRAPGRTPRLIALTGYGSAQDREASAAAGFDAHLTKPVGVVELSALLGRLLA